MRDREFEAGRYYQPFVFLSEAMANGLVSAEHANRLQPVMDNLQSLPAPRTIAELQEQNADEGTHSILDIEIITDVPGFGTASPLTKEQLIHIFGSPRPSLEKVIEKAKSSELGRLRSRWQGLYVIAYANGAPSDIFFCGSSGD